MHLFRVCPHCGVKTELVQRANYDMGDTQSPNPGSYVIATCKNCQGVVFGKIDDLYPKRVFGAKKDTLPESILHDYSEALKCFEVGAYKATAVMCRRVVQSSVESKGGEGKDLLEKLMI